MKIGNNRNPKGKLYTKYFNSVRNLKLNGLIESASTVCKAVGTKLARENQI